MHLPTSRLERSLAKEGHLVIGVDEVGCGCLAGPVVAAAVHLPLNCRIAGIADSKLLTANRREEIFEKFLKLGISWTVALASVEEIDRFNIRRASILAMRRAIETFEGATFALIDAWKVPALSIEQKGIVHGDRYVKSIAAASIIAKVVRDHLMKEYDLEFPGFGLARHKGYATELHRRMLQEKGPCVLHRRSFLKKYQELPKLF